jgi:hypothetical protein
MLERSDIEKYLTNDYGDSFNGYLVLEFAEGVKIPFTNTFYIYLQKDGVE